VLVLFCVFMRFFVAFVMLDTKLKLLKCCLRWYLRASITWSTSDQQKQFSDLDLEQHDQWRLQRILLSLLMKKHVARTFLLESWNVRWGAKPFCSDSLRWYLRSDTTWNTSDWKTTFSEWDLEQHTHEDFNGFARKILFITSQLWEYFF